MFSLLFWLHYSSKPEESIKIRRRYCHSIQRTYCHNRHGVLHRTLDVMPLWTSSPETTESCPERLLHLPLSSSFAQQSHRFHWYPAGQQYQRQSLVIWTLTSDRSGTIVCIVFSGSGFYVGCPSWSILPILVRAWDRHNCCYGEWVTEQLISLRFTFNNKFGHHDRFST